MKLYHQSSILTEKQFPNWLHARRSYLIKRIKVRVSQLECPIGSVATFHVATIPASKKVAFHAAHSFGARSCVCKLAFNTVHAGACLNAAMVFPVVGLSETPVSL